MIIESINLGKGISQLPSGSLQGISNIKSVFIPENILEIENSALPSNLKLVVIEEANPNYYVDNNCVINKHTKELVSGCDNFIIPNGVVKIGGDSLSLSKLSKLEIPYGVTSIEELAFAFCENLKEVTLPSTIKDVEYSAFLGADELYNVYLHNINFNQPLGVGANKKLLCQKRNFVLKQNRYTAVITSTQRARAV